MLLGLALLSWTALAAAAPFPSCVKQTSETTYREPASLRDLLDCQKKKLDRFAANYEAQHGDVPSDETIEAWQELQRGEVRGFIERHPERSVMEGDAHARARAAKPGREKGRQSKAGGRDLEALQRDLWEKSDQGRKGITPEMAADIVNAITDQQGFVSRDMSDLLISVQQDGAQLSEESMRQLKEAARKADAAGLDLGVEPGIKESLLHVDSKKDHPVPAPAAPGVD
jgi:hypothetical protein